MSNHVVENIAHSNLHVEDGSDILVTITKTITKMIVSS